MNFDITAVINGHNEKLIAHKSIRNFFEACEYANSIGIKVEKIAILDNADQVTREQFLKFSDRFDQIHEIDAQDLAMARNYAVQKSHGQYIAFLDGDDFWSINWLAKAYQFATEIQGENFILHSQRNIYFGVKNIIWEHHNINWLDTDHLGTMLFDNLWTALCFAPKTIFMRCPYKPTKVGSGFGYEDWHWNCETLGQGIDHRVVPETWHFIRSKAAGLLKKHQHSKSTIRPNSLFHNYASFIPKLSTFLTELDPPGLVGGDYVSLGLTQQDVEQMQSLSKIEQELYPTESLKSKYQNYSPAKRRAARLFGVCMDLIEKKKGPPTHIIIVPWLKRGGADLASLLHAKSIVACSSASRVLFIGTENAESTWLAKLPPNCSFLPFGKMAAEFPFEDKLTVLLRILLELRPQVIHLVQSYLGWSLFAAYGQALSEQSRLFASVYLDAVTDEGKKVGYAREFLPESYPYLTRVFCDNQPYINELCLEFGYSENLFLKLEHPVFDTAYLSRDIPVTRAPKFLWASRLDRQKRPDILFGIAKKNPTFEFDMFGEVVLDGGSYLETLLKEKPHNVRMRGSYDSVLELLESGPYLGFVYTSEGDGLPNILIEIGAVGVPIIAPNVGGIGDFITSETGYLIDSYTSIEAYSEALNALCSNVDGAMQRSKNLKSYIESYFSWSKFSDRLQSVGYQIGDS